MLEAAGLDHELPDIDGPMPARHVRDDHVEPGPVGKGSVHERRGHVQPSAGAFQHPLNQIADLLLTEAQRSQLGLTVPGHKNFVGSVQPNLFDGWIVQEGLEGSGVEQASTSNSLPMQ